VDGLPARPCLPRSALNVKTSRHIWQFIGLFLHVAMVTDPGPWTGWLGPRKQDSRSPAGDRAEDGREHGVGTSAVSVSRSGGLPL